MIKQCAEPQSGGYRQPGGIEKSPLRSKKPGQKPGFTLIEIIIVVIIMSLIAALVVPRLFKKVEKSKQQITKIQISSLENAVKMFKLDTGRYPDTKEGLNALMQAPADVTNWDGPYLEKGIPKDPWSRDYLYTYPGKNYIFEIVSLGADGKEGGEGEDKDINNWETGTQ